MTSVHYSYAQTAANEFSTLFDGERVFSHPKPVNDIKSLIAYLSNTDDLIVDFFAGSGTSGHCFFTKCKRSC
jgi:adenine-specific DNA-methyltransferase